MVAHTIKHNQWSPCPLHRRLLYEALSKLYSPNIIHSYGGDVLASLADKGRETRVILCFPRVPALTLDMQLDHLCY